MKSLNDTTLKHSLPSFNVLDRNLNVHKQYLIAASAGTGKTFSIENIITRLLIENKNTQIENILAVTFTKAATRDLKNRILNQLKNTLHLVKTGTLQKIPDYCLSIIEKGAFETKKLCSTLENAIQNFDLAQIFTIHGFCLRMLSNFALESDFTAISSKEEKTFNDKEIREIIRDFFRTEITPNNYSVSQLEMALNSYGSFSNVENKIFEFILKDSEIVPCLNYHDSFLAFSDAMNEIKKTHAFKADLLIEDFDVQSDLYKPMANKDFKKAHAFFNLFDKETISIDDFDQLLINGFWLDEFLSFDNIYKNKIKLLDSLKLNYENSLTVFKEQIKPIVLEASHPDVIIARLARDCKKVVETIQEKEEKYRENDLLKEMLKACHNLDFLKKVQNLYKAAIIDEFQDTDPIQWEIFKKLFLNSDSEEKIPFYLVGDPKQSIYAFRQADIYTYIEAEKLIGQENIVSLNTNFRSQKSLVMGLNELFSNCDYLFPLPRFSDKNQLPFSPVAHAKEDKIFSDKKNSIHFFEVKLAAKGKSFPPKEAENDYIFPFIAEEILRLKKDDGVDFKEFAVLVKDKNQAKRLAKFFEPLNIAYQLQRQELLNQTTTWVTLKELLEAVNSPNDLNLIKIALGGEIICWQDNQINDLESYEFQEKILLKFLSLKKTLLEQGFTNFFSILLKTYWHEDSLDVSNRILKRKDGERFYNELYQIACLLMENENFLNSNLDELIDYLKEKMVDNSNDENLKNFSNPTVDAVSILTIHNSKGLEFDIVIALGLIQRSHSLDLFIPLKDKLVPCFNKDSLDYIKAAQEIDAEKMRQLYVALTRAKTRLYIPIVTNTAKNSLKPSESSPLELFLKRLNSDNPNGKTIYEDSDQDSHALYTLIEIHKGLFSYTDLNETKFSLEKYVDNLNITLTSPKEVFVPKRNIFIQSFTSIAKQKSNQDELLRKAPQDFNVGIKTIHNLPSSNLTGLLLHSILEKILEIDFFTIEKKEDLKDLLRPLIKSTIFEPWEDVLLEIGFNALYFPNNNFTLAKVDRNLLYREIEFVYSDVTSKNYLMKGVMDLVFCSQDKYYLLDWKSNWLGYAACDYSYENMHASMLKNDYHLQAEIYKNALKKYLKIVDPRPFDEIFGGCYYIFLRGIDLQNSQYGVYNFL